MKVLVLGGSGMLGHQLVRQFEGRFEVRSTVRGRLSAYQRYGLYDPQKTYEAVDAEKIETIEKVIAEFRPEVIVNAVGVIKQTPAA
jgi:dTDP-4-dehydrorhamnose reductase